MVSSPERQEDTMPPHIQVVVEGATLLYPVDHRAILMAIEAAALAQLTTNRDKSKVTRFNREAFGQRTHLLLSCRHGNAATAQVSYIPYLTAKRQRMKVILHVRMLQKILSWLKANGDLKNLITRKRQYQIREGSII
jgi:hypothetical protein